MHATLIVLGEKPRAQIKDAIKNGLLTANGLEPDCAVLHGSGALGLKRGAKGRTALDEAIEDKAPEIVVSNARERKPRVPRGVDSAYKGDIRNLRELPELVLPSAVLAHGRIAPADASWMALLFEVMPPDMRISIYDLHY